MVSTPWQPHGRLLGSALSHDYANTSCTRGSEAVLFHCKRRGPRGTQSSRDSGAATLPGLVMRISTGAVVIFMAVSQIGCAESGPEDAVVRVYNLPGTPECASAAQSACEMVVRMCASDETECEIQCRSSKPPQLSEACLKTHPCAANVETYCSDMPPGSVMGCLKDHRSSLSAECQAVSHKYGQLWKAGKVQQA